MLEAISDLNDIPETDYEKEYYELRRRYDKLTSLLPVLARGHLIATRDGHACRLCGNPIDLNFPLSHHTISCPLAIDWGD